MFFTIPYIDAFANRECDDALSETRITCENVAQEKTLCVYCGSDKIRFVDFGEVTKRLNDRQIAATEIWLCKNCGKEFQRQGTLYSPEDLNRARLRVAVLSWVGYFAGSMLAYGLYFGHVV